MHPAADPGPDILNDRTTLATLLVEAGSRVLQLGCGAGTLASALADRGCRVWGIEVDGAKARWARGRCEQVITGDVEAMDLAEHLGEATFDAVVVLGVIPRLRDPAGLLRRVTPFLAPGGRVVSAIPNAAHVSSRLGLLDGHLPAQFGDGVRLFDAAEVDRLFAAAGLAVVERLRVTRSVDAGVGDGAASGLLGRLLDDDDALTAEFISVAVPRQRRDGTTIAPASAAASLGSSLQARSARLEAELIAERARTAELEARLAGSTASSAAAEERVRRLDDLVAELTDELRWRMAELGDAQSANRHLELDLHARAAYIEELRCSLLEAADDARRRREESERLREALAGFDQLRYRVADRVNDRLARLPRVQRTLRSVLERGRGGR